MIEFASPGWLRIAYAVNILMLVPVCFAMFRSAGAGALVFDRTVTESEGLRLLVASLWAAILAASIAGLFIPAFFAPIVLAQIVYKSIWLSIYVAPTAARRGFSAVPLGIAVSFALLVAGYPYLFFRALAG